MLAGFLLSLREGLEAALVIGMVLSVLNRLKRSDSNYLVWAGLVLAVVLSAAAALALALLGMEFEGLGEMIFEGSAMLLAAGVLTWLILWVHRSTASRKNNIEDKTRRALGQKTGSGLFLLAFLAVFREGIELALFLLAVEKASSPIQTLVGSLSGLAAAGLLGWILFSSTTKLSLRGFFRITNILLIVFAAGMVASGVHEFIEAGLIPALVNPVWNIGAFISNESELGLLLKSLFGYSASPSLSELLAYTIYLAGIAAYIFSFTQKEASPVVGSAN